MNFNVLQTELTKFSLTGKGNGTMELTYRVASQWLLLWEKLCQNLFVMCSVLFDDFLS